MVTPPLTLDAVLQETASQPANLSPANLELVPFVNPQTRLTSSEWLRAGWKYIQDPKMRMRMRKVVLYCTQSAEIRTVPTSNQAQTPVYNALFTNLDGVSVEVTAWREFAVKFATTIHEGNVSYIILSSILCATLKIVLLLFVYA